ncbi:MAG: hexitol phosphatase HxpB [Leptospiraceae bacterium]|nr:hexitol phosphatase HxpB [Leptospiraceae bacterium]
MRFRGQPIQAVLFDMDGLLVDTEAFWQSVEQECIQKVAGLTPQAEDFESTMGLRIDEVLDWWQLRFPDQITAQRKPVLLDCILSGVLARIQGEARALPGIQDLLEYLQERSIPLALVSSSHVRLIEAVLDRLDWRAVFRVIASAENEVHGKPHPAVWLTAAHKLGLNPVYCLALEDSVNGVISARAARMQCVAIPAPEQRGRGAFQAADLVLQNPLELIRELEP